MNVFLTPRPRMLLLVVACLPALAACRAIAAEAPTLPDGRWIAIDGERIFVRQAGKGPDVVLLHGLGDSGIGWQFLEPRLTEAGYRVTVWDALGTGRSDKPPGGDYSIAAHTMRLRSVLDELGIERATLLGHSLGGAVALLFAQRFPERVDALILIDPAAYREGAVDDLWFWETRPLAEIVLGILPNSAIVRYGLRQNYHRPESIPETLLAAYLREADREGAIRAFIAQTRQLVPDNAEQWERGHRTIDAPTLIIWGTEDRLVPADQAVRLHCDIRRSRLALLPETGHSPHMERPDDVMCHIVPFLEMHVR